MLAVVPMPPSARSAPPRLLLHVQHLLGTGHLRRMAAIAAALAARGAEVTLMSGGMALPDLVAPAGVEFVQLPPMRATDAGFRTLVDGEGRPVDEAWRAARRARVLDLLARVRPDLVLIEHFPFGRRMLDFELPALIGAARALPRPAVLASSVRDVLVAKPEAAKRTAMVARARDLFDHVLFHGDTRLLTLGHSLPEAEALGPLLVETGYVALPAPPAPPADDGEEEILVSAGGGPVGRRLLDCALAARPLSAQRARRWRILAAATGLTPRREPGLIVEPNRPDFPALMARARVSVSQAGYNTVVDLLAARARGVLVPFAEGRENEQSLRAAALAARGLAICLDETELTPDMLAQAIDRAAAAPRPVHDIRLDGAARSAGLLIAWCGR
jgi:predicted glycosyltransferase